MLAWKVAPALACGNVVVLKPAEQTPLSALYFGKLVVEAGLPAGAVNIIPGIGILAGRALAKHPDVDKIAFTGSTNTGRAIMKSAASNLKNITLECGGKNPSLVFADADIEQAVKWCHFGIMDNQGQVCTSTSRIYVQEAIYDAFVKRFVQVTDDNAKMGNAFADDVFQGPQISSVQYEKILSYIEQGKKEGAKLVYGGKKHGKNGYFVEPTVFVDVSRATFLPFGGFSQASHADDDSSNVDNRGHEHCEGRNFWARSRDQQILNRGRSHSQGECHFVRPCCGCLFGEGLARSHRGEQAAGWHGMDKFFR